MEITIRFQIILSGKIVLLEKFQMSSSIPQSPQPARVKRFTQPLKCSGIPVYIPSTWDELPIINIESHDPVFVEILKKHGLPIKSPVPLIGRYSKSRRWSAEELAACLNAHDRGVPVALMSAALNRNPQDIIFRLLDERHGKPGGFKEVGLKNSKKWTDILLSAGRDLFEAGLTAWRVAALFGMDFEGAEKLLYQGREGYGHVKKNPFAVCTDHKQIVNQAIIRRLSNIRRCLEAFAGEGRFAKIITETYPKAELLCIEQDSGTFAKGIAAHAWASNVKWIEGDNLQVIQDLIKEKVKFDLVDLDPFISCCEQLKDVWHLLNDQAALFITFGGEYRRSFIGTNRLAIQRRYGWLNETLSNKDYLEIVPSYFFGWVANQAANNGFILKIEYCVRYANYCRYWTSVSKSSSEECASWLKSNVIENESGFLWKDLPIPRFAQVRYKTDELSNGQKNPLTEKKFNRIKISEQMELID